jgi:hypothetical protein
MVGTRGARGVRRTAMSIFGVIRQLRKSAGLEPSFSDYIAPAVGLVVVGVLAGASLALLFAPSSGKQLREEMEAKLSEFRSRYMLESGQQPRMGTQNNASRVEPYPHS